MNILTTHMCVHMLSLHKDLLFSFNICAYVNEQKNADKGAGVGSQSLSHK